MEEWSGRNYLLTIDPCQCPCSQTATDIEFVTGMELIPVANIDRHRHSGLRLTQGHSLRFTQLGPVTLVWLSSAGPPVSELHEIKRKLATPLTSPIANHDRKECAVLISTSSVAL